MFLLAGVAVVAAVLAGCGGDDGGEGTTGETATGATGGGGTAITIQGFAFDPATLQVSGETTLSISNEDGAAHTFTLDDGSVDQEIPAGESVEVTVNVSESTGFHCEIHRSMTGTLEVA
jgi:plastocyanin